VILAIICCKNTKELREELQEELHLDEKKTLEKQSNYHKKRRKPTKKTINKGVTIQAIYNRNNINSLIKGRNIAS